MVAAMLEDRLCPQAHFAMHYIENLQNFWKAQNPLIWMA